MRDAFGKQGAPMMFLTLCFGSRDVPMSGSRLLFSGCSQTPMGQPRQRNPHVMHHRRVCLEDSKRLVYNSTESVLEIVVYAEVCSQVRERKHTQMRNGSEITEGYFLPTELAQGGFRRMSKRARILPLTLPIPYWAQTFSLQKEGVLRGHLEVLGT